MRFGKKNFIQPNPAVSREIAQLDAQADCQYIVYLLTAYEFSWDFSRALELALFYTYGSATISKLLDGTGEFHRNGQKRYDDTRLLILHILLNGWDSVAGQSALGRINKSHGHYRIKQDDYIFTLWTFIHFPIHWARKWSPRRMTPHEEAAWFNFWVEVGRRMKMEGIPQTLEAYDTWVAEYRRHSFLPTDASARVARSTIEIIEGWLPALLRGRSASVIYSLFDDDRQFLDAIKAPTPPRYIRPVVEHALKASAVIRRHVVFQDYPTCADSGINRTYGKSTYAIEALAPKRLLDQERKAGSSRSMQHGQGISRPIILDS